MNKSDSATPTAPHSLVFKVRDYECDMSAIVNNSVYLNYFEHARHEYLKTIGIDFADCVRRKIKFVIAKLEVEYKRSLVSGDEFTVDTSMERINDIYIQFTQNIFRESKTKRKLIASTLVTVTAVGASGRAEIPAELDEILSAKRAV